MKTFLTILVVALVVSVPIVANANGPQPPPPKWSQPPEMVNAWGYDLESDQLLEGDPYFINRYVAADDWQCMDGLPITDIHWWGSYFGAVNTVDSFRIIILADDPDVTPPATSHPLSSVLASYTFNFSDTHQTSAGTDANGHAVYNYSVILPQAFEQEVGTYYWLVIEAVRADKTTAYWGWHTATLGPNNNHNWDPAVTLNYFGPANGDYDGYTPLEYQFPSGEWAYLDLAFELTTVPEPSTIMLMGGALAGLVAVARRKFFNR